MTRYWVGADPGGKGKFGLGVDAPMWWSSASGGDRNSDRMLRKKYGIHPGTVQSANSLWGAALVGGMMLAFKVRQHFPGAGITEARPEALLHALELNRDGFPGEFGISFGWSGNEDEQDAAITAICASEGFGGRWKTDLAGERFRHRSERDLKNYWLAPMHCFWPCRAEEMNPQEGEVMHERILDMLRCRYDRAIINNTERGDYVECMIALALGKEWALTSEAGWDWAAWDCEHVETEARLEIKQSAARQSWDGASDPPRRSPRFDIASRKGFWPKQGGPWVAKPGRLADIYVFAWHGETGYHADHRKATQWRFFVLAERALPAGQSTIGLGGLEKIAKACGIAKLGDAVRHECPPRENLRAATTSLSGGMP